jgi:diguanylate cyclase (GGDEF)-like protein
MAWIERLTQPRVVITLSVLCIGLIGYLNWLVGVELRIFPLYFLPLMAVAWWSNRWVAMLLTVFSTLMWVVSLYLGGRAYSSLWVWLFNGFTQFVAFLLVTWLVASLRSALLRERALSRLDPLTGLSNSRAFFEQSQAILSLCRRKGWPVTLAFIDLDHFKRVNDTLGHAQGDEVLRQVALLLDEQLRDSDIKARLGGDEFVILLPSTDYAGAEQVLGMLLRRLHESTKITIAGVTASIGAVCAMDAPYDVEVLVRAADDLMYEVKAQGRDGLRIKTVA